MDNETLLKGLIQVYENEFKVSPIFNEENNHHFTQLIIAVTRYIHDIRYCPKTDCRCSPEYKIQRIVQETEILEGIPDVPLSEVNGKTIRQKTKEIGGMT